MKLENNFKQTFQLGVRLLKVNVTFIGGENEQKIVLFLVIFIVFTKLEFSSTFNYEYY